MKTLYNTKISIEAIDGNKYDMLIEFLEDSNIPYREEDFEEYEIDERTEDEKYEDWLAEQADELYEDRKLGIR